MRSLIGAAVLAALLVADASAQQRSGSALPRYVSLRSEEVNVRQGPGVRYPVEWVFKRRDLPVEVLEEFEHWRKVRDWQGTEGWVHQSMLSAKRTMLIVGELRALHERPEADAAVVAQLEPGVVGGLLECRERWCRVTAGGYRGWLRRSDIWGVGPSESVR